MHPIKLLGDVGPMESCFGPFGDGVVSVQDSVTICTKRTIGSETILDTPDGTPRLQGSIRSSFLSIWR
jgi:hypothetical protein